MAPFNTETPATPRIETAFSSLKAPHDKRGISIVDESPQLATSWTSRVPIVGNLLQVLIVAAMVVYACGQLFYFSETYCNLRATIGKWFRVPADGSAGGHPEMVQPTYFFLVGFLPMAASLVLLELLRHFQVRRITSRCILSLTRVLRRKPRVLGWVVRVSCGELLFLIFLVGGNIYVFEYYCSRQMEKMGVVCMYNMAFLFLPATRNCVWMEFLNISYANGIKYHRWVGVITVVTALLHCLGYYWMWIKEGTWIKESVPCFNCEVGKEGKDPWMNFFGLIAGA